MKRVVILSILGWWLTMGAFASCVHADGLYTAILGGTVQEFSNQASAGLNVQNGDAISGTLSYTAGLPSSDATLSLMLGDQPITLMNGSAFLSYYDVFPALILHINGFVNELPDTRAYMVFERGTAPLCQTLYCDPGPLPSNLTGWSFRMLQIHSRGPYGYGFQFDYPVYRDQQDVWLNTSFSVTADHMAAVPEPASLGLVGFGLLLLLYRHRYFRAKHQL